MNHLFYHLEPYLTKIRSLRSLFIHRHYKNPWNLNIEWGDFNYNRIAFINLLLSRYSQSRYLEIGCASNALFDSVYALSKTGVDPNNGGNIRMTSDEFFITNKQEFDVVFIDGLHTYHQARNDFINAAKCLSVGGIIAFHDMLPKNWIEAHPSPIIGGSWTGDVWKLAFELKDICGEDFNIISIDHGVGFVQNAQKYEIKSDHFDHYQSLPFEYYVSNFRNLPIISHAKAWEYFL